MNNWDKLKRSLYHNDYKLTEHHFITDANPKHYSTMHKKYSYF